MLNSLASNNLRWFEPKWLPAVALIACFLVLAGCATKPADERPNMRYADNMDMPSKGGVRRKLLKRVAPEFPMVLRKPGMSEVIYVRFTVEPDGHLSNVTAESATNPELAKLAVAAVEQWLFEPASDDQAVKLKVPLTFEASQPIR